MQPDRKIYLVTGAAGFIGARFVASCKAKEIDTLVVDSLERFGANPEHPPVDHSTKVDRDHLFEWLESHDPILSAIVHFGACSNTLEKDAFLLKKLNTDYSKTLWNYAYAHHLPFIYASSAATYGDGSLGYEDNEEKIPLLCPLNAYGKSKQAFDLWALEQEAKKISPPTWTGFKFFNVYGYGERHKNQMASVILHAFNQILQTGKIRLFKSHHPNITHGEQKRDFIWIEDVLQVIHFALEKPINRGIYNLGTGQARSFLDLANAVFKAMEQTVNIEFIETPLSIQKHYQYYTVAKMDRLQKEGYSAPFTSLEEGVRQYVQQLHVQQLQCVL